MLIWTLLLHLRHKTWMKSYLLLTTILCYMKKTLQNSHIHCTEHLSKCCIHLRFCFIIILYWNLLVFAGHYRWKFKLNVRKQHSRQSIWVYGQNIPNYMFLRKGNTKICIDLFWMKAVFDLKDFVLTPFMIKICKKEKHGHQNITYQQRDWSVHF